MIFITLGKWKQAPKKEMIDQAAKRLEELEKQGIKMRVHWALGRYDIVAFTEASTEKDARVDSDEASKETRFQESFCELCKEKRGESRL